MKTDITTDNTTTYEDEIIFADYFLVIWKYRLFIALASILPAIIFGAYLYFSPRTYEVTYLYDVSNDVSDDVSNNVSVDGVSSWDLTQKNYDILLSRFYSETNLNNIIDKLRANNLNNSAAEISKLRGGMTSDFLMFRVSPPYVDFSKLKVTNPEELKKLRDLQPVLLNLTIKSTAKDEMRKAASVICENIEQTLSVYLVDEKLLEDIRKYKSMQADIEANKFDLDLDLMTSKNVLAGLSKIQPDSNSSEESNVNLMFDVGNKNQYLPLEYQIRAVEANIVELENQVNVNALKYGYYEGLLGLYRQLHEELQEGASSDYTINDFYAFLTGLYSGYDAGEIKDYLGAYTKRIEDRISANVPVSDNPSMSSISKGTVKKSAALFVVFLMMSTFASFVRESISKSLQVHS